MNEEFSEHLRLKKALYQSLDSLDDDDDTADSGRIASQQAWNKALNLKPTRNIVKQARSSFGRSVSDSRFNTRTESLLETEVTGPPSSTDPQNVQLNRSTALLPGLRKTMSDTNKKVAPEKTTGKRKCEVTAKVEPKRRRIFDNLHFFFFPNSATNAARRMRIEKAAEHGATWEQKWNDRITHVILDASMEYSALLRGLGLDCVPQDVVVVRDSWPAECISYRALLDPIQRNFVVDKPQPSKLTQVPSTESNNSLQTEPVSRSTLKRRAQTPSTTSESHVAPKNTLPAPNITTEPVPQAGTSEAPDFETSEEFDKAISQAKLLQDVPLDEEDGNNLLDSFEGQGTADSGDDENMAGTKHNTKRKSKYNTALDRFQCTQKHTGDGSNSPNLVTIRILEQMADYYGQTGDEWRVRAYRKAVSTLRNHPVKVQTKEQALALPNVGDRLAAKIEEIASTNRLKRLESARAEPGDQVLQTFMQVYGAGLVQASRWVDQGYKSLDELLEKAYLTDNQRIGIEHFVDFNSRIPRAEVERHGSIVGNALLDIDANIQVIIGGSYRRGSKDSGDIDLIITRPDTNADYLRNVVLGQLVPRLSCEGFLVASLAITSRDDGSKWHGASCLPDSSTWRRLDLLLVPSDELGAALIYFTGNDIFNRSLRLLASTKGMRLNQRGLYKGVIRGPDRTEVTEGVLVEGRDEKKIFKVLGIPWRPPEHRIC